MGRTAQRTITSEGAALALPLIDEGALLSGAAHVEVQGSGQTVRGIVRTRAKGEVIVREVAYVTNDRYFATLESGCVVGGEFAVLQGGRVVAPSLYLSSPEVTLGRLAVSEVITGRPDSLYVVAANSGWKNFYHWMTQALPTIIVTARRAEADTIMWVTPPLGDDRLDLLASLGIGPERTLQLADFQTLAADRVMYSNVSGGESAFRPWPDLNRLVDSTLLGALDPEDKPSARPTRLYISRGDSPRRPVANEEHLISALVQRGFTPVRLSEFDIGEQIRLFRDASVIVGPHGAGLSHLRHCRPGTRVVELFAENYLNACYERAALAAGLNYAAVVSPEADSGHRHLSGWAVDVDSVLADLQGAEIG